MTTELGDTPMVDLSDPIDIAGLQVKNRLVLPPMVRNLCTEDGRVTDKIVEHYEAISKGGMGLIIVEAAAITWEHRILSKNVGIHDDALIPGLKKLADGIKAHDARAFIQINHSGPKAHFQKRFVGPSNIPVIKNKVPEPLSIEEIEEIREMFVDAARRAQSAGFDGVEVHGAHFYLLSAFLSSYTNRREDEYGGSTKNKAKFTVDVIQRIREALGDYPIILRINGMENVEDGITLEEGIQISKIAETAGIDALHVSCVVDETYNPGVPPRFTEETMPEFLRGYPYDCCIPVAREIKPHVKVPVIGVGMVRDPQFARRVMMEDTCDLLGVGRALLADPEFVNKTLEGRDNEIIPWKDAE
jgi:2,4-dienoyl-CoA reductase-like NADH-dependent reductase (Old Yellow Enzyme family)